MNWVPRCQHRAACYFAGCKSSVVVPESVKASAAMYWRLQMIEQDQFPVSCSSAEAMGCMLAPLTISLRSARECTRIA